MISFSLTELGMPSLRAVLGMTWAEYLIRVDGWKRVQNRQMYLWRRTWFNTLIGPHLDPKKLPKTENQYMPLDGERNPRVLSDYSREKFMTARAKYEQEVKQNKAK